MEENIHMSERKEPRIKVGITHGDINGIGYEVIIKTLSDQRINELCIPVVYGSSKVASFHRKLLNIQEFNFNLIKKAELAHVRRSNIINITEEEIRIDIGKSTEIAGLHALQALEIAINDLKSGQIDVLVTAPVNKKNMQSEKFRFPGHTEYLASKFNATNTLMLMVSPLLRIGVVTGHIPLQKVSESITEELLMNKIQLLNQSLMVDFGIVKPRIALLGLNPHAGDKGVIGNEDQNILQPVVQKAFSQGILVSGPFAADGFFGNNTFRQFDGVLAMYHDQGLIPFKTLSMSEGVNFTAGLPVVRTSPAHGTAYDIAGKDIASPDSFRAALFLALDIYRNRMQYKENTANPLPISSSEKDILQGTT